MSMQAYRRREARRHDTHLGMSFEIRLRTSVAARLFPGEEEDVAQC